MMLLSYQSSDPPSGARMVVVMAVVLPDGETSRLDVRSWGDIGMLSRRNIPIKLLNAHKDKY